MLDGRIGDQDVDRPERVRNPARERFGRRGVQEIRFEIDRGAADGADLGTDRCQPAPVAVTVDRHVRALPRQAQRDRAPDARIGAGHERAAAEE